MVLFSCQSRLPFILSRCTDFIPLNINHLSFPLSLSFFVVLSYVFAVFPNKFERKKKRSFRILTSFVIEELASVFRRRVTIDPYSDNSVSMSIVGTHSSLVYHFSDWPVLLLVVLKSVSVSEQWTEAVLIGFVAFSMRNTNLVFEDVLHPVGSVMFQHNRSMFDRFERVEDV